VDEKKNILAIDDLPLELAIYRNILGRLYNLRSAGSAPEALHLLATVPVDLIILDIEMPGMSGFELLHQIRLMPKFMNIPIIIVSSHSGGQFIAHAMSQGADDLLPKPVNPAELLQRIGNLLEKGTPPNRLIQLLS
jgi:CheY-like chemotaxis protein